MLIIKRQVYCKRYAYGGSGLLSSVGEIVKRLITSKVAKKLAADTSKKLLEAGPKKVGEVVVNKTQKIINKIKNKSSTSLTPESMETLQRLTNPQVSINNSIAGSGQSIAIEKLACQLNTGTGLKVI